MPQIARAAIHVPRQDQERSAQNLPEFLTPPYLAERAAGAPEVAAAKSSTAGSCEERSHVRACASLARYDLARELISSGKAGEEARGQQADIPTTAGHPIPDVRGDLWNFAR